MLFLLGLVLTSVMVHAQNDQSGFISLDCGIDKGLTYTDDETGINYISDADFRESGVIQNVSSRFSGPDFITHLTTLTYFPENSRNCYTLRPSQGKGNRYLIRARFMYGNYDSLGQSPEFDVHLGPDYWNTVKFDKWDRVIRREIIHVPSLDYIHVCLVNTNRGTPFISVLEVRPLPSNIYNETNSGSLSLHARVHFNTISGTIRYTADKYDRIWLASVSLSNTVTTISSLDQVSTGLFEVPIEVMSRALTLNTTGFNNSILNIYFDYPDTTYQIFIYLHFAEINILETGQIRKFSIFLNDYKLSDSYSPLDHKTDTLYILKPLTIEAKNVIKFTQVEDSTLPPILNAYEIYMLMELQQRHTYDEDAAAIMSIKSSYSVIKNWQGDPCAPKEFVWDGLGCSNNDTGVPRIIFLNLSSYGLEGEIHPRLADLTMIESLDLSNNKLNGTVPAFLSGLKFLKFLNIKGNNLTGPIPKELLTKSNEGSLSLSFDGESTTGIGSSCGTNRCENKNDYKFIVPVVAIVAVIFVIVTALMTRWIIKKRKADKIKKSSTRLEPKKQKFTYLEVKSITNNFEVVIGKGGFGKVYHGYIGDVEVAVKMLSESSQQGDKEFQSEAYLLLSIHHKNLISFVGYCDEDNHRGIIYEYMAKGNLERRLFDTSLSVLNWEERLQICCDTAQGLEYLHHGCKPPIVHRDVKCTNILLSGTCQAKVADFGLSKAFATEGSSHISTVVAGTRGYLDPEYFKSSRLTEKSDVYSFGVVLLVIITGQPAITVKGTENIHITQSVQRRIEDGELKNIVDPRLLGNFDINSAWKLLELSMNCIDEMPNKRPTMNEVVKDLTDCLVIARAYDPETKPRELSELNCLNSDGAFGPNAR